MKSKSNVLKKLEKFPKSIRKRIEELILILKETTTYLKFDLVKMKGYEILDVDFKGRI